MSSRRTRSPLLVCCWALMLLGTLALATPAQATRTGVTTIGGKWIEATFTENATPLETYDPAKTYDQSLINQAVTLLGQATKGSAVSIDLHSLDNNDKFEQAVAAARDRGVHVGIVFGGTPANLEDWASPTPDSTKPDRAPTYFKRCDAGDGHGAGCLSGDSSSEMHAKFMLFSEINRDGTIWKNVVWIPSGNMTKKTGAWLSNNAVTVFDATELYGKMREIWLDQYNSTTGSSDYYNPGTGKGYWGTPSLGGNAWLYISPDSDPAADMWKGRLDDIKPPDDGGGPCEVLVMQTQISESTYNSRQEPVDQLVTLKKKGCSVDVVVNKSDDGDVQIGALARKKFYCAGITTRWARVHDKAVIFKATANGVADRPVVITGSHNMTKSALRYNDEIMARFYDSPGLHTMFRAHFYDAFGQANTAPRGDTDCSTLPSS